MSFLEQFLKESTSGGRSREPLSVPPGSRLDRSIAELSSASGAGARRGYSIESDEGDVEDNRAVSNASSRSNMSELSAVSFRLRNRMLHHAPGRAVMFVSLQHFVAPAYHF